MYRARRTPPHRTAHPPFPRVRRGDARVQMLTQTPVGWRPARCVRGDAMRRRTALRTRRRIVRAIEMFVQTATKITTRVVARPRRVSRAAGVTRAQNALHVARIVEFAPKVIRTRLGTSTARAGA